MLKMKNPLVSVIMPCYNYGKYIGEALQSVLNSTYKNVEIIVVDSSTEKNTLNVLKQIKNKKVRIIYQKKQGLPAARNFGIQSCRGKYILPLDADDLIHKDYIIKGVIVLEQRPDVGVVYSHVGVFGDKLDIWYAKKLNISRLIYENHIPVCSLFRKQCWKEVNGYDEEFVHGYEDWEFWIKLAEKGWKGYLIDEPLFFYRVHKGSLFETSQQHDAELRAMIRARHKRLYRRIDLKLQWFIYRLLRRAKRVIGITK